MVGTNHLLDYCFLSSLTMLHSIPAQKAELEATAAADVARAAAEEIKVCT